MKSIYSEEYVEIITRLRALRMKNNISQTDMATLLNVNQSFISKVENRERRLDVIEFLSWIDALNANITDVLPIKYTKGCVDK